MPDEPRPSQSLGFVKSLLAVGCMVGVLALMAGRKIEPRSPSGTALEPPVLPQGAVFLGGISQGKELARAGHAVAIQVGGRELVVTSRTLFGPATREEQPERKFRLVDPDQRVAVEVGQRLAFGICRPDGTPHVPEDYAVFELRASDATAPLTAGQSPKLGDPLWIAAHSDEGLKLTLVEVAETGPRDLTLFMDKTSCAGWAGAPCLNAKGEVVAMVSNVLEGQDAALVQAVAIGQALAALEPAR